MRELDLRHSGQDVRRQAPRAAACRARRRDPIMWLIICGCVLVAAIILGTIMMVGEFRERAIANSERELENAVLLLTRHFDQQFDDTEVIAADFIAQMKVSQIDVAPTPSATGCRRSIAHADAEVEGQQAVLYRRGHDLRCGRAADQLVRAPGRCPTANVSDREYFQTFKTDPQSRRRS